MVLECFGNHRIRVALKSRQTLVQASPARAQKYTKIKTGKGCWKHQGTHRKESREEPWQSLVPISSFNQEWSKTTTSNKRMFENCIKGTSLYSINLHISCYTMACDSLSETPQTCRRNTKVQTNDHSVLTIANTMDRSAPMERILQLLWNLTQSTLCVWVLKTIRGSMEIPEVFNSKQYHESIWIKISFRFKGLRVEMRQTSPTIFIQGSVSWLERLEVHVPTARPASHASDWNQGHSQYSPVSPWCSVLHGRIQWPIRK